MSKTVELVPGTLPLLVLRLLSDGDAHGYAIARRIEDLSEAVLSVEQGSIYPALYRLERAGFVNSQKGVSDTGRPVKVYKITSSGRKHLEVEMSSWNAFVHAMSRVIRRRA